MDYKHIDSWKNSKEVFLQQLALNQQELRSASPPKHWYHFVNSMDSFVESYPVKRVVDIGCGAGVYSELVRVYFPSILYLGYDYSENALNLARKTWSHNTKAEFKLSKYQDVSHYDIKTGDVIVANGLLDILPNGEEALEHILSLSCGLLILQRINFTSENSCHETYSAYGVIDTYNYSYNVDVFHKLIKKYGYRYKTERYTETAKNIVVIKDD